MPPLDPQAQQVLNQRNGVQAPAQAPQQPAQPARGPVYGPPVVQPPPNPVSVAAEDRQRQENTWRVMTAQEAQAAGLPQGVTYQVNGLNEIKPVGGQTAVGPSQQATSRTAAEAILRSTGVDLARNVDPVADLIRGSTSGGLERTAADAYAWATGDATSGMENISALQTIQSDMTLLMTGGSLGAQISNADRDFINQRMGDIANPNTAANARLAAWEQVKARLASAMGAEYTPNGTGQQRDQQQGAMGGTVPQGATPPQGGPGGGAPQPTLQDMYPQGGQLGMDTPDQPFDEMAYLRDTYGIEPGQERQLVGMLNAAARGSSRGQFTANDVQMIYSQLGIPLPDEAGIQQLVEGVRAGNVYGGFDTSAPRQEYERMLDQRLSQGGNNPEGIGATIGAGASQGVTLSLADEAIGVGEAVAASLRGDNPFTAYQVGRDTDRRFNERSQEANPWTYGGSTLAGALVTGGVRAAPAIMRAEAPVAAAAREGAIFGGINGFGAGEGPAGSLTGAMVGAGTGAALGAGIAKTVQAAAPSVAAFSERIGLRRRPATTAGEVAPVMQAGERMDVPVRRADVDPAVRQQRANVLQGNAGQPVRDMEAEDLATMEQALARSIGREGATRDQVALGDAVQRGAGGILRDVRNRATRLYTRARGLSEGVTVQPENMLRAIDENIAELTANGATQNAAMINYLRGVRQDALNGGPQNTGILDASGRQITRPPRGLSIDSLRAQRTQMRGNISTAGLNMTDMERRMTNILRAASRDIEGSLANNPQALQAFREGDRLWREQALFERQIARRIIGTENSPVAPAAAAQRVTAFFNNDPERARAVWNQLSDEVRSEIQAQLVANIGRQSNGNFSLATFLTHTSGGSGALIPPRTMRILFGDEGMRAINDLRTLAGAKVAAAERTNRSNTGGVMQSAARGFRTMLFGAVGVAEAGATGGIVAASAGGLIQRLGEQRAVRLLTNPNFTGWLRRLPETDNPRTIDASFSRLRRLAAGNAQFQSDVQAFERALLGAVNDNAAVPANVAAEPQGQQQR
jgi:hypothetical protein